MAIAALAPSHYRWRDYGLVAVPPGAPDPEPGVEPPAVAPAQPGAAGNEWLVAVAEFGPGAVDGRVRGVLWGARIEQLAVQSREQGGNRLEVVVPASRAVMRLLGDPIPNEEADDTGQLFDLRNVIARELLVGSTADGLVRWRFVIRDAVRVSGGQVRIPASGIVGGLTSDRIIGAATPRYMLGRRGRFLDGLTGWTAHGVNASVSAGGVDGGNRVALTSQGDPHFTKFLEARQRFTLPAGTPWGGKIGAVSWVRLPNIGREIDGYGVLTVGVTDAATGEVIWPNPRISDADAGVVTDDMRRDDWDPDQVSALGHTGNVPLSVDVRVRIHPVSSSQPTYFAGVDWIWEEGTGSIGDRVNAIHQLFHHAQHGREKSTWGVTVHNLATSGISESFHWPHPDRTPMNEAIEEVCSLEPGLEVWDDASRGRAVVIAPRRGRVREDVIIRSDDLLGMPDWSVDPGGQFSAARATSSAASLWGGSDAGAVDTSQTRGQVRDVTLAGPAGMRPNRLTQWVRHQLATLSRIQGSTTVVVPWALGMRLAQGDTVRVALRDNAAGHLDWMRVMRWVPDLVGQRWVLMDLGTDVERGGSG